MPKDTAISQLFKFEQLGLTTARGILDWLITVFLVLIIGYNMVQRGGFLPAPKLVCNGMIVLLIFLHAYWIFTNRDHNFRFNLLGLIFLPFLIYVLISYYWITPVPWLAKDEFLLWAQGMVVFWVSIHNLRRKEHLWFLIISLLGLAFINLFFAHYQYLEIPKFEDRAPGTFSIPNSLAALLCLFMPLLILSGFAPKCSATLRILCFYKAVMFSSGIVISGSRGGSIGILIAILALPYFISRQTVKRLKFLGIVVCGCIVTILVVYFFVDTYRTRVDRLISQKGEVQRKVHWAASWEIFKDHPVSGSGAASFDLYF